MSQHLQQLHPNATSIFGSKNNTKPKQQPRPATSTSIGVMSTGVEDNDDEDNDDEDSNHNNNNYNEEDYLATTQPVTPAPTITMLHSRVTSSSLRPRHQRQRPLTTTTTTSGSVKLTQRRSKQLATSSSTFPLETPGAEAETTTTSRRASGRHSCSVSEFNRFKNALLTCKPPRASISTASNPPNFLLTFTQNHLVSGGGRSVAKLSGKSSSKQTTAETINKENDSMTTTQHRLSKIRSIYEQVELENQQQKNTNSSNNKSLDLLSSVELKRANHMHSMRFTHELLSSSLSVKKLN